MYLPQNYNNMKYYFLLFSNNDFGYHNNIIYFNKIKSSLKIKNKCMTLSIVSMTLITINES